MMVILIPWLQTQPCWVCMSWWKTWSRSDVDLKEQSKVKTAFEATEKGYFWWEAGKSPAVFVFYENFNFQQCLWSFSYRVVCISISGVCFFRQGLRERDRFHTDDIYCFAEMTDWFCMLVLTLQKNLKLLSCKNIMIVSICEALFKKTALWVLDRTFKTGGRY